MELMHFLKKDSPLIKRRHLPHDKNQLCFIVYEIKGWDGDHIGGKQKQ